MNSLKTCVLLTMLVIFASPAFAMDSNQATKIIKNAYEDILGREPDPSGLHEFRKKMVDDGWTEAELRKTLKESDEYKLNVINNAYEDLLDREVDESGRKYLLDKMTNDKWTESDVRKWIKESDEYKKKQ